MATIVPFGIELANNDFAAHGPSQNEDCCSKHVKSGWALRTRKPMPLFDGRLIQDKCKRLDDVGRAQGSAVESFCGRRRLIAAVTAIGFAPENRDIVATSAYVGLGFSTRRNTVKDLVWDNVLSVGVDEIDDDHQKLIHLLNILNHATADGESKDYLAAVLEELINCTVWHFSHEERLMLKHGYQAYADHKAEHQELIQSALALQQKILQSNSVYTDEDLQFLERWLAEHILTSDGRLGTFLSHVM